MYTHKRSRHAGFLLIEVLVALLLISIGLLAVSKLQSLSMSGAGEAKSRSEAVTLSQKKLEELRNILIRVGFTGTPLVTGSASVTGTNATYSMTWTVSTPNATLEQRLLQLRTTWTDRQNASQTLDLNSLIAWDDPGAQAKLNAPKGGALISPTGAAQRGSGNLGLVGTVNPDGSRLYTDGTQTSYLLSSTGDVMLYLPPIGTTPQSFTTITGKVFFDQNAANNSIPSSSNVRVRLSSEGECIYNSTPNQMTAVSGGSNSYQYFTYTCYVGPGWYGNVGVVIDDSVNGQAASPTICVGDPAFNGGVSDSTLIGANSIEAAVRSYRGFKGTAGAYLSTGVAGGRKYGLSASTGVSTQTAPFDGRPIPSAYPAYYPTVVAGSATDYFEQNFLVTHITGNGSCYAKMTGGVFTRNAGKYFCINPDNDTSAADVCPSIWPGFEGEVGNGGSINYTLIVSPAGNGTGTVTSSPTGISCGTTCSASFATGTSVTLTAAAASGSSFGGWSGGGCSGTGICTVALNAATTVVATFNPVASTNTLTVVPAGTGTGTVVSSPAGISCGATCSFTYASGTAVSLTATPSGTSTFTGWSGGGCSGTGTCTVTLSAATSVTATFAAATTYTLSVTKVGAGTGTVTSSPAGITCGATCSAAYGSGASVVLTAAPASGTTFAGWSGGACSGTNSTCTVTMNAAKSVTATFNLNAVCTTPISGTAHDKFGSVVATGNSGGSCAMAGGNSSNYSCSGLTAPTGSLITLTNSNTNGNSQYSYTLTVTANCTAQVNVNFP